MKFKGSIETRYSLLRGDYLRGLDYSGERGEID